MVVHLAAALTLIIKQPIFKLLVLLIFPYSILLNPPQTISFAHFSLLLLAIVKQLTDLTAGSTIVQPLSSHDQQHQPFLAPDGLPLS